MHCDWLLGTTSQSSSRSSVMWAFECALQKQNLQDRLVMGIRQSLREVPAVDICRPSISHWWWGSRYWFDPDAGIYRQEFWITRSAGSNFGRRGACRYVFVVRRQYYERADEDLLPQSSPIGDGAGQNEHMEQLHNTSVALHWKFLTY
jgi:hypothetical protein